MISMDVIEQINSRDWFYLGDIREPADNALRLVIEEAGLGAPQDRSLGGLPIPQARPVGSARASFTCEILFKTYIAYVVCNESLSTVDDSEVFTGRHFRVDTRSRFLDYVQETTLANVVLHEPYRHYCIICLNHVVDVASMDEPSIRILKGA
jgi:hypothetical protein